MDENLIRPIYNLILVAQELVQQGRVLEAESSINEAIEQSYNIKEIDIGSYINSLQAKASLERVKGNIDASTKIYKQIIRLLEEANDNFFLPNVLVHYAINLKLEHNLPAAISAFQQAKKIIFEKEINLSEFSQLLTLINTSKEIDKDYALAFLEEAVAHLEKTGNNKNFELMLRIRLLLFQSEQEGQTEDKAALSARLLLMNIKKNLAVIDLALLRNDIYLLANVFYDLRENSDACYLYDLSIKDIDSDKKENQELYFQATRFKANALFESRHFKEAEELFKICISFSEKYFGKEDAWTLDVIKDLCALLKEQGRYREALKFYERTAAAEVRNVGQQDSRYINSIQGIAVCYDQMGVYSTAEIYYKEILKLTPSGNNDHIKALSSLADLTKMKQDYLGAEYYFRQALEMTSEIPADFDAISYIKNNLGEVYTALGKHEEAFALISEAAGIRKKEYGEKTLEYARSLTSLTNLEIERGNNAQAIALISETEQIYKEAGKDDAIYHGYYQKGEVFKNVGDYTHALEQYYIAEKLATAFYGTSHFIVYLQEVKIFLCLVQLWLKDKSKSNEVNEYLLKVIKGIDFHLIEIIRTGSTRSNEDFLEEIRRIITPVLLIKDKITSEQLENFYEFMQKLKALETLLLSLQKPGFKGSIFLHAPSALENHQYNDLIEEITALKRQLVSLQLNFPASSNETTEKIAALKSKIDILEKKINSQITSAELTWQILTVKTQDIINKLKSDEVLIEYLQTELHHLKNTDGTKLEFQNRYYAFIIHNRMITLRELGPCKPIDEAIESLRENIRYSDPGQATRTVPQWKLRSKFLYNQLIKPIEKELAAVKRCFVSGDGLLNILPFELLITNDDTLLFDSLKISYINAGKDLMKSYSDFHKINKPIVLTAPTYSLTEETTGDALDPKNLIFTELPSAINEGREVADLTGAVLYKGKEATETIVLNLDSPEILHIATHGFYIPHQAENLSNDYKELTFYERRSLLADPLDRCGLAFAGANDWLYSSHYDPDHADGILFAAEIINIDLRNTELVTLSACDSGLGDLRQGDVVNGLRKAFLAAGCRGLLFALWEIPDEPTKEMMVVFYKELMNNVSKEEALLKSKLHLKKIYKDDPLYWAGFIFIGEDQPLIRFSQKFSVITVNFEDELRKQSGIINKDEF